MTQERRHDVGILRAMGSDRKSLLFYFMKINIIYILLGSLVGFGLSFLIQPLFAINLTNQLNLPELSFVYEPWSSLRAIIYVTLFSLLAIVISSRSLLKLPPSQSIRGESLSVKSLPESMSLLERLFIWPGRSTVLKYAFRSLTRRGYLTALTIVSNDLRKSRTRRGSPVSGSWRP